eukprot:scaffold3010_cov68-Skeletonema_marinoi.AAC.1
MHLSIVCCHQATKYTTVMRLMVKVYSTDRFGLTKKQVVSKEVVRSMKDAVRVKRSSSCYPAAAYLRPTQSKHHKQNLWLLQHHGNTTFVDHSPILQLQMINS